MPIDTKNAGAYAPISGVTFKMGGVYAALVNIFAKVGGIYQPQLNLIYYSTFSGEVFSAITANALRTAALDSKRSIVMLDNPATNQQTFEFALVNQANNNRNPPSSGWTALAPGGRATITGTDAPKQVWARVATASTKAVTAATCSGTTATLTIPSHGIPVGSTVARSFEGITPSGYNVLGVLVTATDANTITTTVGSTLAAATAFGYMLNGAECITTTTGTLP